MKFREVHLMVTIILLSYCIFITGCIGTSSPTNAWEEPMDETTGKPVPGMHPVDTMWHYLPEE